MVGKEDRYLRSMANRMLLMSAPPARICIASRATSRQMPQPTPCGSHAVTRPRASREATKQSSLLRCPRCSQPQKHGTCERISGCRAAYVKTARTISGGRAAGNDVGGNGGRSPSSGACGSDSGTGAGVEAADGVLDAVAAGPEAGGDPADSPGADDPQRAKIAHARTSSVAWSDRGLNMGSS